jgi:ribonucleotide reductase beta subunit family protein with ferritin-like domain
MTNLSVNNIQQEPLLTEDIDVKNRFVMFPVKYNKVWEMYKQAVASFWTADELNLQQDIPDLEKLSKDEKHFINHILAFFAASDGIVSENLSLRFYNDIPHPEVRAFYGFQVAIEQIHSETYSLLIDLYVKDAREKNTLFNAVTNFPAIRQKADWAIKWMVDEDASFAQRLFAFAIVEGIFFSASFCAIFWLRERGLLPGLSFANQLISRDEGLHTEFACVLYNELNNRLSENVVHSMIEEAVNIEMEFITESIPCAMIGMNADLMRQYIKYVADRLIKSIGYKPIYKTTNPFDFMEFASLEGKTNFFERRVAEYSKAGVSLNNNNALPDKFEIDLEADDF